MGARLAWIPLLERCLSTALDGGVEIQVRIHVDPIRRHLVMALRDPLPKNCWNPLQILVHGFANVNECRIQKMWKTRDRLYEMDLSMKRRNGPRMARDPFFVEESEGAKKWREEFMKRMRDKAREPEDTHSS